MRADASSMLLSGDTSKIALASALQACLTDHSLLNVRLQKIPYDWSTASSRLTGHFCYLAFADGVPTIPEFVDYLYDRLVPYCIPRKKYLNVLNGADPTRDFAKIIRLGDEAKNLFIRARNQLDNGGEVGELILYSLLEWAIGAPRLISKMYLKTNNNMSIHGSDGIHVNYDVDSDTLSLYIGESKLYKDFSTAAVAAFSSIGSFISNATQINREIELLTSLSDIETLPLLAQQKLLDYLDPYSLTAASLKRRIVHACFIGFEYSVYQSILSHEPQHIDRIFKEMYQ